MKKPASEKLPHRVWLDTDIGDDTDDIFALALLCASPELKLTGVSTVFGETGERARLVQTVLKLNAASDIPAVAGCGHPLASIRIPELWPNGPMVRDAIAQLPCAHPATRLPAPATQHAVDLLADQLRHHPGEITPIAIGPLTNLATLLLREPALQAAIPRLVVMAGEFKQTAWEWNVRCDPLAAACVVGSNLPIDFIPWDIGMTCTVSQAQLDRLFASRTPTGRLLARAVRLWRKAKGAPLMPHLFDPMAVAVLLHPEWFEWRRGRVTVSFAPETFSHTLFTSDPKGPHRVAWNVKPGPAVRKVWARILSL